MNRKTFIFYLLLPLMFAGCYEEKVREAAAKLQIGISKNKLDVIVKDLKFLKEQSVEFYPNFNEEKMRASLTNNKIYEEIIPENLIDILTFDGNVKVYSYLIFKKKTYANPPTFHYLAIFLNKKEDKVIGWGRMRTSGDVDTWRNKF